MNDSKHCARCRDSISNSLHYCSDACAEADALEFAFEGDEFFGPTPIGDTAYSPDDNDRHTTSSIFDRGSW